MEWETLQSCLQGSDDTAGLAARLLLLADELQGSDAWKFNQLVEAAQADDPPGAALLLRNIKAVELYVAALRDLRAAIIARHASITR